MTITATQLIALIEAWLWPFLRVSALLMAAPVIGTRTVPVRIRLVCEELGPTFVKFGQIMSLRPDLLPPVFIQELSKLQDEVAPEEGRLRPVENPVPVEFPDRGKPRVKIGGNGFQAPHDDVLGLSAP